MSPRVLQVIESEVIRGAGTEADPHRMVKQYHTLDGELLAERDPFIEDGRTMWMKSSVTVSVPA